MKHITEHIVCWSGLRANGMSLGPALIPDWPSACLDHRGSSERSIHCGPALDFAHFVTRFCTLCP